MVPLTAYIAVALLVAGWISMWWAVRRRARAVWLARWVYLSGAIVMIVHVLCAYGIAHHWSHQAALDHTAEETLAVVGIAVPYGLYFNFLFVAVHLLDAIWRLRLAAGQSRRPNWLARTFDGFLLGMVLMSTVVF